MNPNQDNAATIQVDQAGFESEVLKSKQPVLVAFWAPWSRPCHVLASVLDEIAVACATTAKVVKVNADDCPDLSMWYEIQSIPTLLVFVDGALRARVIGTASKEAILSKLESVLHGSSSKAFTSSTSHEHDHCDL